MRMLLTVKFCNKTFNELVRKGSASQIMKRILDDLRPEAAYFTAIDGRRTGIFVINLTDPSKIPAIAEPFFLQLNAEINLSPCMLPEDLAKANLESLGKAWA